MSFDPIEYLAESGLGDSGTHYQEIIAKANLIIMAVDTSNSARLPTDDIVASSYSLLFEFGSLLNSVLAARLEHLVEVNEEPKRSSSIFKEFNLFYQYLFAGWIKPLNQIIAFQEHRL